MSLGSDHELVARCAAAEAAKDHWSRQRFRLGERDCAYMLAWYLRRRGYSVKMPPKGSYRTPRGATRELDKRGHASVTEWIESFGLVPIAPAAAVVGDVLLLPAEHALGCIAIALGNGRVLAYHESVHAGAAVLQPLEAEAAWRVGPPA